MSNENPAPEGEPRDAETQHVEAIETVEQIPSVLPLDIEQVLTGVANQVNSLVTSTKAIQEQVNQLDFAVAGTTKSISYLPQQIRGLGGKVEALTSSVSEPRIKAVLGRLVNIYDLVTQMRENTADEPEVAGHRRNYGVLVNQIRQMLTANGLEEIDTSGPFDPDLHCAVETVASEVEDQAGMIADVVRSGFRTDNTVLRHAEVVTYKFVPPASQNLAPEDASTEEPAEADATENHAHPEASDDRQSPPSSDQDRETL